MQNTCIAADVTHFLWPIVSGNCIAFSEIYPVETMTVIRSRVFHDKIKFYILRQIYIWHALMIFQMWNGAWNKLQFKVCQVAQAPVDYLDKHSTLDPVMVSVVWVQFPVEGGNFLLKFFKPRDVNSGLKCKYDLIVKTRMGDYN